MHEKVLVLCGQDAVREPEMEVAVVVVAVVAADTVTDDGWGVDVVVVAAPGAAVVVPPAADLRHLERLARILRCPARFHWQVDRSPYDRKGQHPTRPLAAIEHLSILSQWVCQSSQTSDQVILVLLPSQRTWAQWS
jgi:hypothetical protein